MEVFLGWDARMDIGQPHGDHLTTIRWSNTMVVIFHLLVSPLELSEILEFTEIIPWNFLGIASSCLPELKILCDLV